MNNPLISVFKSIFIHKILAHPKNPKKSEKIQKSEKNPKNPKIRKKTKKYGKIRVFFWGFKIRTRYLGVKNPWATSESDGKCTQSESQGPRFWDSIRTETVDSVGPISPLTRRDLQTLSNFQLEFPSLVLASAPLQSQDATNDVVCKWNISALTASANLFRPIRTA